MSRVKGRALRGPTNSGIPTPGMRCCSTAPGVLFIQITAQPPPPGTPDIGTPALRTLVECRRYRRVAEKTGLHVAPCSGTHARRGRDPGAATPQGLPALALGLAPGSPTPLPARS